MTYVIIVTYGDRKQFLEQILFFFNTYTSLQLVIINNNSEYSVNEINLVLNNPNVFIINSAVNKGSAWGYKTGIQYACNQQNCEMIWLLDDDNLPETNTLEILQSQYEHLQSHSNFKHFALMPFRTDRSYLSNVIQGEPIKWNFPQKNAFLGFHIFKLHFKLVKKLNLLKRKSHSSNFVIPCAPYGGFFFHKDLIKLIGLPDERFFVYADDFEFTYRITEAGGAIFLIENARISDLEQTWQTKQSNTFSSNILSVDNNKVYFSIRNFVQKLHLVSNNFIFTFNRIIYSNYLSLLAFFTGKQFNYRRFLEATNDGLKGNFNNKKYPI